MKDQPGTTTWTTDLKVSWLRLREQLACCSSNLAEGDKRSRSEKQQKSQT